MIAVGDIVPIREGLREIGAVAAAKIAQAAFRVPTLRDAVLSRLLRRLDASYDRCVHDGDLLRHQRWFACHLRTFLRRLVDERPAAAQAILRFIGTWTRDVYRRSRAARNGWPTPCTVVIELTDRCNLNCPGCYAKSGPEGHDLPWESLVEIVEQVVDLGVTLVTISGGEPFLRERADRSLTRLAERHPDRGFLVFTNGTLIDPEIADRLARVGNVFPAISVEGFERQTDARRGQGTYELTRAARQLLAERGVLCGFSATVTRENAESICTDAFVERRIAEGDLFGWFFLLQPIGRAPRVDLIPAAEQRAMLRQAVIRWRAEDRPIFLGDFWNDGPLVGGCIAGGRYYFHIRANGDISPCVFAPVACGNVLDILEGKGSYADLKDFVQNSPVFRAWRDEQKDITDRDRPCLLIDHPHAFRRIARTAGCRAAANMPGGYLDGEIAQATDAAADDWRVHAKDLPPYAQDIGPHPALCGSVTANST